MRTIHLWLLALVLLSCSNENVKDKATSPVSHKKGLLRGKQNFVQIPLTAEEQYLLGKVKSVSYKDYSFEERNGKIEKVYTDTGYNVYDEQGHLIDQNEYTASGEMKWKCVYKYGPNNKALEFDLKFKDSSENSKVTFVYDNKGNKIERVMTNRKPENSITTKYKYDDKNNLIEEIMLYPQGDTLIIGSRYDDDGNEIERLYRSNQRKSKTTAVYDKSNFTSHGELYNNDTLYGKWTAVNDSNWNRLEEAAFKPDGSSMGKTVYKYDKANRIIESTSYNASGAVDTSAWNSITECEYDKHGNAVKETYYRIKEGQKIPEGYTEAVYTYYE